MQYNVGISAIANYLVVLFAKYSLLPKRYKT